MAFVPSASWNSRSITHLANYPSPSLPMISSDESKFNAVKAGLFAKHVVIPVIDGADSGEFPRLVADLQREFQPEGPAEEFYVAEMAKSMWRVRRASLCEKGSVRSEAMWAGNRPLVGIDLSKLTDIELSILKPRPKDSWVFWGSALG